MTKHKSVAGTFALQHLGGAAGVASPRRVNAATIARRERLTRNFSTRCFFPSRRARPGSESLGRVGSFLRDEADDAKTKAAAWQQHINGTYFGAPDAGIKTTMCGRYADVSNDSDVIRLCQKAGTPRLSLWFLFERKSPTEIEARIRELN